MDDPSREFLEITFKMFAIPAPLLLSENALANLASTIPDEVLAALAKRLSNAIIQEINRKLCWCDRCRMYHETFEGMMLCCLLDGDGLML